MRLSSNCCSFLLFELYRYYFLQTPHVPPFLAQCLQYLQFLQARQSFAPVQVAAGLINRFFVADLRTGESDEIKHIVIMTRNFISGCELGNWL